MTQRQMLWKQYYEQGYTPSAAAKAAGYKNSYAKVGERNKSQYEAERLTASSIEIDPAKQTDRRIADLPEITAFWTSILRDGAADLKDRLKVSELLAKTQGLTKDADGEEADPSNRAEDYPPMSLEEKLELIRSVRTGEWDAAVLIEPHNEEQGNG